VEPAVFWISGNILFIGLTVCLIFLLLIYFELYRRRKLKRNM